MADLKILWHSLLQRMSSLTSWRCSFASPSSAFAPHLVEPFLKDSIQTMYIVCITMYFVYCMYHPVIIACLPMSSGSGSLLGFLLGNESYKRFLSEDVLLSSFGLSGSRSLLSIPCYSFVLSLLLFNVALLLIIFIFFVFIFFFLF